jgi:hypothetical protein
MERREPDRALFCRQVLECASPLALSELAKTADTYKAAEGFRAPRRSRALGSQGGFMARMPTEAQNVNSAVKHVTDPDNIVANEGWIEVRRRCRPKTDRFRMLTLLWIFPSGGAALILGLNLPDWSHARGLAEHLSAVALEQWIALVVLMAHPVFGALAWHYHRAEVEREVTFREPNPDPDLRNLH